MKSILRYVYLNMYGLLLLFLGLVLLFTIPTLNLSVLLFVFKCIVVAYFLFCGIRILASWSEKKKHYGQLISINKNRIKDESFESFMQTPCGRLLTKSVLRELNKRDYYPILKAKYVLTIRASINNCRHPEPSTIKFTDKALELLNGMEK